MTKLVLAAVAPVALLLSAKPVMAQTRDFCGGAVDARLSVSQSGPANKPEIEYRAILLNPGANPLKLTVSYSPVRMKDKFSMTLLSTQKTLAPHNSETLFLGKFTATAAEIKAAGGGMSAAELRSGLHLSCQ